MRRVGLVVLALLAACKAKPPPAEAEADAAPPTAAAADGSVAALTAECDTTAPRSGVACDDLGDAYAAGKGAPADPVKAVAAYRRSCDKGFAIGCLHVAKHYADGDGAPKDLDKAALILDATCARGLDIACDQLGELEDKRTPPEAAKAADAFRRGCDLGYARACRELGRHYRDGAGVTKDTRLALSLYERGCDGGDAVTCYDLGEIYAEGLAGVPVDAAKARGWYAKGCAAKFQLACTKAEELK